MNKCDHVILIKTISVVLGSLILGTSVLLILINNPSPVQANTAQPTAARHVSLPPFAPLKSNVTIVKTAETDSSADGSLVYGGDTITYSLTINTNNEEVYEVEITDILPLGALTGVECLTEVSNCVIEVTTTTIPLRGGGDAIITKPERIKWTFPTLNNTSLVLQFKGQVICQPDGSTLSNQAALTYKHADNSVGIAFANALETEVQTAPPQQAGRFYFSAAPELCSLSGPEGGTTDMDWGDFDNDGDLDVALIAPNVGYFVYQNTDGVFELLWSEDEFNQSEGIRWGNFTGDEYLELLVSGEWDGINSSFPDNSGSYSYTGYNYLYKYNGTTFDNTPYDSFTTNDGAWRGEVADFNGDGLQDVVMFSYYGGCSAHLYKSQPGGFFQRATPPETPASTSYCLFGPPYFDYGVSGSFVAHHGAWGDFDNDGDPDLVVGYEERGLNTWTIEVFENINGVLSEANTVVVATGSSLYVYDLAWGDYNGDGYMDLAAAFSSDSTPPASPTNPGTGAFRIYQNNGGVSFSQTFSQAANGPISALDWADFSGNGQLELVVAKYSAPPTVIQYTGGNNFSVLETLNISARRDVFAIRAVDHNNDGDLDLAFTNFGRDSWLFTNTAPFMEPLAVALGGGTSFPAGNVTWGAMNDGALDLLYGTDNNYKIFQNNEDGTFSAVLPFGFNPPARSATFSDVDIDNDLDVFLGANGQEMLYQNTGGSLPNIPNWTSGPTDNTYNVFTADVDQDNQGRPDLIVSNSGSNALYMNERLLQSSASPNWNSLETDDTRHQAWGYLNSDVSPDIAAANNGQPLRIYQNTGLNSFSVVQSLGTSAARGVDWGDYDNDGDMDLAVGNFGQAVQVYNNSGGNLTLFWTAPVIRDTTGVAWGDWDNDGDLDLAVGNHGQQDQIYLNLGSVASFEFQWIWESSFSYNTTSLDWGDYDNDGDIDLALSQDGNSPNGVYENTYAQPAHIIPDFSSYVPLPQNPSYLSIDKPGTLSQIFQRTVLSDPTSLTIPLSFTAYDPDGTRVSSGDALGDKVKITGYEYSMDGGGRWFPATITPSLDVITTSRQGRTYDITWQAGQDIDANTPNQTVTDLARFRITTVRQNNSNLTDQVASPVQRVAADTVSPLFRVRSLSCVWPEDVSIIYEPPVDAGTPEIFFAQLNQGTGNIVFTWEFGDGNPVPPNLPGLTGQLISHIFTPTVPSYPVTVTVTGEPCPVTRPTFITTTVTLGNVEPSEPSNIYLPIILKAPLPDLIGTFTVNPPAPNAGDPVVVTAVITNQGTATADSFWVDFYINPSETPAVNKRWNNICGITPCKGIAWLVPAGLQPGDSVTLTSNSFDPEQSLWPDHPDYPNAPDYFVPGTSDLQLYVDSWNPGVSTGGVYESNESNNLYQQPISVLGLSTSVEPDVQPTDLPARPAPNSTGAPNSTSVDDNVQVQSVLQAFALSTGSSAPIQVTGLQGRIEGTSTALKWNPHPEAISGYRIYRMKPGQSTFTTLAEVPPDVSGYTDTTAACGYTYFVTAFNTSGESLASTSSYFSPPCQ